MNTFNKICKRSVWVLLTVFFAIWFVVFTVGKPIAMKNDGWINKYFDINPWEMVKDENDDPTQARYYKSDYETMNSDGTVTYNHNAMRNNSMSVATKVATEGSVLLWNDDVDGKPALPLAGGSKISLFGISCLESNYIYSGEGSGHVTITTTDNPQIFVRRRGPYGKQSALECLQAG